MKDKQTAKRRSFLVIALAAIIGFSFAACGEDDNGGGGPPAQQSVTYTSKDSDGNFYTLVVTENTGRSARYAPQDGDSFSFTVVLFNNGNYSLALTYSGTIESAAAGSGTEVVIGVTVNGNPLTITVKGTEMTVISGTIVLDNEEEITITEPLTSANTPEDCPDVIRWSKWEADDSTATVAYSVDSDEVCTITVGGTPMTGTPAWNYVWKVNAAYAYTAAAGKTYTYEFEAWTEDDDRTLTVQWYNDWVNDDIHSTGFENEKPTFTITSERKIYTLKAIDYVNGPIPKSGVQQLEFQCANQTGTFSVKIHSITAEEYKSAGQLTITNFRGTPGLRSDKWTMGGAYLPWNDEDEWKRIIFIQLADGFSVPASGDSITVNVYNAKQVSDRWEKTTLFTGNVTVDAGSLQIDLWGGTTPDLHYTNKVPIVFTNGSATIDFGTQMVNWEDWEGEGGGEGTEPSGGGNNQP